MPRIQMHIESTKWINPGQDYSSNTGHDLLGGNL